MGSICALGLNAPSECHDPPGHICDGSRAPGAGCMGYETVFTARGVLGTGTHCKVSLTGFEALDTLLEGLAVRVGEG